MTLHRIFGNIEDANAAAWELMEAGMGGGRTRVIAGERPAVEVDPAFGTARTAIGILEKRRPGDTAPAAVTEVAPVEDYAAAAGGDDPAPFSRALNWPVLTRNNWFFSSLFGWRLLSDDPAPFSRLLGLKVLSNEKPSEARGETRVNV